MTIDQLKSALGNHKWSLVMALVMMLMIGFGYQTARYFDEGNSKKVRGQQETISVLSLENNQLTTKVNQLEVALELAKLEKEKITTVVSEQRKELEAQQELLTFYERVMAPEKAENGFVIKGVEVFKLADNRYQLRMVLLQSRKQKAVINGALKVSLVGKKKVGQKNDKEFVISSGNPAFIEQDIKYRFRFFQAVNIAFQLPENVTPESISFTTAFYQYKTKKGNYELSIPWDEALSTVVESQK